MNDVDACLHEDIEVTLTEQAQAPAEFRVAYDAALDAIAAGYAAELTMKVVKKTRTIKANACMWAHLRDLERQVIWYGNKLSSGEWKEVISASLHRQKVVPGIDGSGFVVIGARTSRMSIAEMGLMIEAILAFGAQQQVRFSAPRWMWDTSDQSK